MFFHTFWSWCVQHKYPVSSAEADGSTAGILYSVELYLRSRCCCKRDPGVGLPVGFPALALGLQLLACGAGW